MSNYIETAFMQQRTDFMKTLPDRRKRFSIPNGVDMYLDIEYVNDQNEAHRLDVFRPSESPDKELPIIFNVHWRRPDHGMQRVQPLLLCQIMQTWLCRV